MERSEQDIVLTRTVDGVGILTLNRPHTRNAFTPTAVQMLIDGLRAFADDPSIRAAVLHGADGTFCSGADIGWEAAAETEEFRAFIGQIQLLTRVMRDSRLFVIAAIEGYAVGGGAEIALAADYRVARDSARIGFPEATLGLTVTGGTTHFLPARVGTGHALELLLSGRLMTAREARTLGLLEAISEDDPLAQAIDLGRGLNSLDPDMVADVKASVYQGVTSLEAALLIETTVIMDHVSRPATRERLSAFFQRRSGGGGVRPSPGSVDDRG